MNDLNPLPFGLVYCNCWGFTVYGWLTEDYFVVTANFPGAALGAFYMSIVLFVLGYELAILETSPQKWNVIEEASEAETAALVEEKKEEQQQAPPTIEELITKKKWQRDVLTTFMWVGPILWGFLGTISFTYLRPNGQADVGSLTVGIMCGVFAMSYFASPLSTMVAVCKEGDASSLYPPMVIANIVNCFCWVIYGLLAINDPIIYGQNAAGLGLQFLNLLLILAFPRKRAEELGRKETEMKRLRAEDSAGEGGGESNTKIVAVVSAITA